MHQIAGIPYTTAEFNEKGDCIHAPAVPEDTRELIVVSHGWNNSAAEASTLYSTLFGNFARVHPGGVTGLAIVGVIWPSKQFDFAFDVPARGEAGVVAAGLGGPNAVAQESAIARAFAKFEEVFAGSGKERELADLRKLLGRIQQPEAQEQFVIGLRAMLATPDAGSALDGSKFFFGTSDPHGLFQKAERIPASVQGKPQGGGADAVHAAGLTNMLGGVANAVSSLLNLTTYYEMKERAGTVGTRGVAPLIDDLAGRNGTLRHIHLVGHSFGARLVTAAAMASTTGKLHSLSLLQAAFSHNGFSEKMSGYFRKVIASRHLSGPIIITHTHNDTAVGKAYAIASRLSGTTAAGGVGGAQDKFGGLGSNGALHMEDNEVSRSAFRLLKAGEPYTLQMQMIHNLESSPFIADHGDVAGEEVAWAISQAIATAP